MDEFKTPVYQRKAYKNYLERKKSDEEFIAKRKLAQKAYYQKNKEKILQKIRDKKKSLEISDSDNLDYDAPLGLYDFKCSKGNIYRCKSQEEKDKMTAHVCMMMDDN